MVCYPKKDGQASFFWGTMKQTPKKMVPKAVSNKRAINLYLLFFSKYRKGHMFRKFTTLKILTFDQLPSNSWPKTKHTNGLWVLKF